MSTSFFKSCPRCGTQSYEQLLTHGHCIECLYSADLEPRNKKGFFSIRKAEEILAEANPSTPMTETNKLAEVEI